MDLLPLRGPHLDRRILRGREDHVLGRVEDGVCDGGLVAHDGNRGLARRTVADHRRARGVGGEDEGLVFRVHRHARRRLLLVRCELRCLLERLDRSLARQQLRHGALLAPLGQLLRPFCHPLLHHLRDAVLLHGVAGGRGAPRGVVGHRHRRVALLDQFSDHAARGVVLVEGVRQLIPYLLELLAQHVRLDHGRVPFCLKRADHPREARRRHRLGLHLRVRLEVDEIRCRQLLARDWAPAGLEQVLRDDSMLEDVARLARDDRLDRRVARHGAY
mmetsp:Transcript_45880/g.109501  ORF Transcript_45880/g.109501 Transcript_45880/m.109501 type:complete len:274 (-) Transcript_45880:34-855(-)